MARKVGDIIYGENGRQYRIKKIITASSFVTTGNSTGAFTVISGAQPFGREQQPFFLKKLKVHPCSSKTSNSPVYRSAVFLYANNRGEIIFPSRILLESLTSQPYALGVTTLKDTMVEVDIGEFPIYIDPNDKVTFAYTNLDTAASATHYISFDIEMYETDMVVTT